MSDRTNFQFQVVDCPADQVSAILDVIEELGLGEEWDGDRDPNPTKLRLGQMYVAHEVPCGSTSETASTLTENAPGASWMCWEDPNYEWLGEVAYYTPNLGLWRNDCDANGEAQFSADMILGLLNTASPSTSLPADMTQIEALKAVILSVAIEPMPEPEANVIAAAIHAHIAEHPPIEQARRRLGRDHIAAVSALEEQNKGTVLQRGESK